MKLLIVDDQVSVVDALKNGIDWKSLGFTEIDTAYNSLDARQSLQKGVADVMLCDIEMPGENGLQLFRWMRQEQGMRSKCIFLTSHMKFDYAQEAVKLGGFDYIIQPAPYSQIREAVARAVTKLLSELNQAELNRMGKLFMRQEQEFAGTILADFITGQPNKSQYTELETLGILPKRDQPGVIILVDIQRCAAELNMSTSLITFALGNIAGEVFEGMHFSTVTAYERTDGKYILCITSGERKLDQSAMEEIRTKLLYLSSVFRKCMKGELACYMHYLIRVADAPSFWPMLVMSCKDNVTGETGVFTVRELEHTAGFHVAEIRSWQSLLEDGYADAVESQAFRLLDRLVEQKKLDSATLKLFFYDCVMMFSIAASQQKLSLDELTANQKNMELCRNAMLSVDNMKQFLHMGIQMFSRNDTEQDQDQVIDEVMTYINKHIDSELRRDDIADKVHMNPDYLTRLFKKKTGVTIKEYVIQRKMEEAKGLIETTNLPISFIAAKVGYGNFSHFSSTFKKAYGLTPNEIRQDRKV